MGERMKPLDHLGRHVADSLERAREKGDAGARVRARLIEGREADTRAAKLRPSPFRLRRGPAFAMGTFAAAAVLVAVVTYLRPASRPEALTFRVGSEGADGVAGAFLAAPPVGELPLSFSDGTSVRIGAGARARIGELSAAGARVLLERGVVHANVVHRAGTHWRVDAGPFEVAVTGTRFDVAWEPHDEAIVVTLYEGSVVVRGCGIGSAKRAEGQRVSAGQELRASCKSGTSNVGLLERGDPARDDNDAGRGETAATHALPAATAAPTSTASSLPMAFATPAGPKETPPAASVNAAHVLGAPSSDAQSTAAAAPTPRDRTLAMAPSAATLIASATSERYAGRFDAATRYLLEVRSRFRGSDAAGVAAFELGRLAFDTRRDLNEAAHWFDTYLEEQPRGAFAREALGRSLEARHRGGDVAGAEGFAIRYLAAYPNGPHATLARHLTGTDSKHAVSP